MNIAYQNIISKLAIIALKWDAPSKLLQDLPSQRCDLLSFFLSAAVFDWFFGAEKMLIGGIIFIEGVFELDGVCFVLLIGFFADVRWDDFKILFALLNLSP